MATGQGSVRSSLATGNDFLFDYLCSVCGEQDGVEREAVGWCKQCRDYLCASCFEYHLKPRPMRDHTLLGEQHMPKRPSCSICTLDGKGEKDAMGYCKTCDDFLCSECFQYHLRPKPMRHHELLDQSNMPSEKQGNQDSNSSRDNTQTTDVSVDADQPTTSTISRKKAPGLITDNYAPLPRSASRKRRDAVKTRAEHVRDIKVILQDEVTSGITGSVTMPGNKLVVVDNSNNRVKLIDLSQDTILAHLDLPPYLHDITKVDSTTVVLTSWNEQTIYFLKVTNTLEQTNKVKVKGQCRGIACIDNKLVVTYRGPTKVDILSMTGKVLQTVVNEQDVLKNFFTEPHYVQASTDQAYLYITDYVKNLVTSLSTTGNLMTSFEDVTLLEPRGLAVDGAGCVYVCGSYSGNLVQLGADLTQPRTLLQKSDGLQDPMSVCYCRRTDRLYVGMWRADVVKVFKLK